MVATLICLMLIVVTSAVRTNYGNLIGRFEEGTSGHQIAGSVYAVDEDTLYIREFAFDMQSTCAVFYVGTSAVPQSGGVVIPVGVGLPDTLRIYQNENVMITLPEGKIVDYNWFSIWCEESQESFAHIIIPNDFKAPEPKSLGRLNGMAHGVRADEVIILNAIQIKFIGLSYDGSAPGGFFWTGKGIPNSGDYKVPHPPGDTNRQLPKLDRITLTITFPEGRSVDDVDFIGIWCIPARQNFGHILIKDSDRTNIPPAIEADTVPIPATRLDNCQVLLPDRFHIAWTIDQVGNKITLEFRGIIAVNQYLAFGISGSSTSTRMTGSDVTVVWFDPIDSLPRVEDYDLNAYSQCIPTDGRGACPDTLQNGVKNTVLQRGFQRNGISAITIERPLNSSDSLDKDIITSGDVYVSWGIGFINPTGHVAKHDISASSVTGVTVRFGRSTSECPDLKEPKDIRPEPWTIEPLRPKCGETLTAVIGPSGGERGYQGIANQVGWGLAWYINDLLIPEIHVQRGCSYTFMVNGGDDKNMTGSYHPFYISDSIDGGFLQKAPTEQNRETKFSEEAEGALCEFKGDESPDNFQSFEVYKATLTKYCSDNSATSTGVLTWTVTDETPDLVYYQCYQHRFFGWKIHVSSVSATQISVTLVCLCSVFAFFSIHGVGY